MKESEQFNATEYEKIMLLIEQLQQLILKINQLKLANERIAAAQAGIIAIIHNPQFNLKIPATSTSLVDLTHGIETWFNAVIATPALAENVSERVDASLQLRTCLEQLRNVDQHLTTMVFAPLKINLPANTPTIIEKKNPIAGIEVEYKYYVAKQTHQLAEIKVTTEKSDDDFKHVVNDAFAQALQHDWQNFTVDGSNKKQQLEVLKFISRALNDEQKQLLTKRPDENAIHRLTLLCNAVVKNLGDAASLKLAHKIDQQKNEIKIALQKYDINNLPISMHTQEVQQVAAIKRGVNKVIPVAEEKKNISQAPTGKPLVPEIATIKRDVSKATPITKEKKVTSRPPVDKFSVNEIKPSVQVNAAANKLIDTAEKILTNANGILAAGYLTPVNDALRLMWTNNIIAAQASLKELAALRTPLTEEQSNKITAIKEQLQPLISDVNHPLAIDIHQRAKELAQGYLKQSTQLFSNLPKSELSELDEKKRPNCAKITQHFQSISISVVMDILAYASPIERKLVMEKWLQVMDESYLAGDFVTLFAIAGAFGSAAITRLKSSTELMTAEYREKLKKYEQFPEIAGQYKKYQEEYKSRDGMLPFLGIHFSHLEFAKRGNNEEKAREIISKLTNELVAKIENFLGKKLPESAASTTKVVTMGKDDYEMINKQQYDISLTQEPRNLPANVLRVINPELRNFLLAKNVALTEEQLAQLNNLAQEPDDQALSKILSQLHVSATELEVKKINSLNKQIYSIVSQVSPVDKSMNEKYIKLLNKNVYADLLAMMIRNYLAVGQGKIISQSERLIKDVMIDINQIITDLATKPKADRSNDEKKLRDLLSEINLNFSKEEIRAVTANLLGDEALSKIAIEVKQIANRAIFPIDQKVLVSSDLAIKKARAESAIKRLKDLLVEVNNIKSRAASTTGTNQPSISEDAVQYLTREINQLITAISQLNAALTPVPKESPSKQSIVNENSGQKDAITEKLHRMEQLSKRSSKATVSIATPDVVAPSDVGEGLKPSRTNKPDVEADLKPASIIKEIVMAFAASQAERTQQIMPFDKLYTAIKQSVADGKMPDDLTPTEIDSLTKLDNSLIAAFQDVRLRLEKNSLPNNQGADDLMPLVVNRVVDKVIGGLTSSPKVITAWQEIAMQYSAVDSGENAYVYASVNIAIEYIHQTAAAIKFPEDFESHFASRPEAREYLLLGLKHNLFSFSENDLRKTVDWTQTQPFKLSKNEQALVNDLDNIFALQKENKEASEEKKAIDPEMIENFKRIAVQEIDSFERLQKEKLTKEEFNTKLAEINNVISSWQNKLRPGGKNHLQDSQDNSLKIILPLSDEGIKQLRSQENKSVMKKKREAVSLVSTVALIPRSIPRAVDKIIALFKKNKPSKHKPINKAPTINANVPVDEAAVVRSEQKIKELQNKEVGLSNKVVEAKRNVWFTKHLPVPNFLLSLVNPDLLKVRDERNACRKNIAAEKKKLLGLEKELAVTNKISAKSGDISDYGKEITELVNKRTSMQRKIFTVISNSWLPGATSKLVPKRIRLFVLELFNPQLKTYEAQAQANAKATAKEIQITLDHMTRVLQPFLDSAPKTYDANTVAKLNNDLNLLNNLYDKIRPDDKQGVLTAKITVLKEQIVVILLKYIGDRTDAIKEPSEQDKAQLVADMKQLDRFDECKDINQELKRKIAKLKHEVAELQRKIDKALEQKDQLSPNSTNALFQKEKPLGKDVPLKPEQEMKEEKKIQLKL